MIAAMGFLNYVAAIFLVLFGIYVMMHELNLVRKIIGMVLVQTGVIMFYLLISFKSGAGIPIIPEVLRHGAHLDPNLFANPLPHALMLTAIVVGVSTLGVALVLAVSVYRTYNTLEEDEILKRLDERFPEKRETGS